MYDPELAVANKALDQARRELTALRSVLADVRAMVEEHGATVCPLALVIYDRLASLPPVAAPNEEE